MVNSLWIIPEWVADGSTDDEATQFQAIRNAYLPEVMLAFINVLSASARFVTRELLLKCLDLAVLVAEEGSEVGECFVEAGKMPELVTAFAFTSQAIIRADEAGRRKAKGRRKLDGKSLEIWSTKVRAA